MLILFLLCTLSVASAGNKATVPLPADIHDLLLKKSLECIAETGADVNILQRALNWQYDNDKTSKLFYVCVFKKTGFSNEFGHFDVDKVMTIYDKSEQKELIREVAIECNKKNENNPLDTIYTIILCFYEKTPVLLQVKSD